jgi:hypothetical protein
MDEFDAKSDELLRVLMGIEPDVEQICKAADAALLEVLKLNKTDDAIIEIKDYGVHKLPILRRKELYRGKKRIGATKGGWRPYFDKITRIPITTPFFDMTADEIENGIWLHPVDLRVTKHEDLYRKRASKETIGGSQFRHRTVLAALRQLYGSSCRESKIWGMFAFYIDSLGDGEPLSEGNDNRSINITCFDGMVGTRVLTFENALLYAHARPDLEHVIIDVLKYLLIDPFFHSSKLKKMLTAFKMTAHSLANDGSRLDVKWNGNWFDPQIYDTGAVEIQPNENDAYYYDIHKIPTVTPALNDMRDNGMHHLADMCVDLLNGPNLDRLQNHLALYFLNGMTGFTRTNIPPSHEAQIKIDDDGRRSVTASEYMMSGVQETFQYALDNGFILNSSTFRRDIYSNLKSTSAGGFVVERNVYVKDVEQGGLRAGRSVNGYRHFRFRATQKPIVVLGDPERFTTFDKLVSYDSEHPMRAGTRFVTDGKAGRLINMDRVDVSIFGRLFAIPYTKAHNDIYDSHHVIRPYLTPYDSPWCFTAGKETGDIKTDHRWSLVASTLHNILCEGSDYDKFDAYSRSWNARVFHIAGASRVLKKLGEFEPGLTYDDMMRKLWGDGYSMNIHVTTKGPVSDKVLIYDGLPSGKNETLNFNNETNRAIRRVVHDHLGRVRVQLDTRCQLSKAIDLKRIFFQGDDMMAFWDIGNRSQQHKKEIVEKLNTAVSEVAADNGQSINKLKNIVRCFLVEYLKKVFTYGYAIPRGQIQPIAGENGGTTSDSMELLRSIVPLLDLFETRLGSRERTGYLMANMLVNGRRNYNMHDKASSGRIYIPFSCMWVPQALGGVGRLPWSIAGSNLDNVITIYSKRNPSFRRVVNEAAFFISKSDTTIKDEIKRTLQRAAKNGTSGTREQLEMYREMAPGIHWIKTSLDSSRVIAARYAAVMLSKNDAPKLGDLFYPDQPITTSVRSITESKAAGLLRTREKIESGFGMYLITDEAPDLIGSKFGWLDSVEFIVGSPLPAKKDRMDLPNAAYNNESILRTVPFGTTTLRDANSYNASVFLNSLFQDPLFPKSITVDMILNYISKPKVLYRKENVYFALVGMGASASAAARVADLIYEKGDEAAVKLNATHVSLKSESLSWISRENDSYSLAVDMAQIPDKVINQVILEAAFGYSIMSPVPSHVSVKWTDKSIATILEQLGGMSIEVSSLYAAHVSKLQLGIDPFTDKLRVEKLGNPIRR